MEDDELLGLRIEGSVDIQSGEILMRSAIYAHAFHAREGVVWEKAVAQWDRDERGLAKRDVHVPGRHKMAHCDRSCARACHKSQKRGSEPVSDINGPAADRPNPIFRICRVK